LFAVHDLLVQAERMILTSLFALNRRFISSPRFKWQKSDLASFKIALSDVTQRLEDIWSSAPAEAILMAEVLLDETAALAESQRFTSMANFREAIRERRLGEV
jgi:hypothetical protein